jgi:hypothetical protein
VLEEVFAHLGVPGPGGRRHPILDGRACRGGFQAFVVREAAAFAVEGWLDGRRRRAVTS